MNKLMIAIVIMLLMFGCIEQKDVEVVETGNPPTIVYFKVTPDEIKVGEEARLEWLVENATSVTIEGIGNVPNSGSIVVKPQLTTTYILNAFNENGKSTKSITIEVEQYQDKDGDGYTEDVDCDDNNRDVYPGAKEVCNGIDDDCNGVVDDAICEDDGNPCTEEKCINATCVHEPLNDVPCDDGNPLTINDKCVEGICTGTEI